MASAGRTHYLSRRQTHNWSRVFWLVHDLIVGYVVEAYDTVNERKVAIKRTTKAGEYVSREFEVLEKIRNCENCVQLLDIYYSRNEEGKKI